ncbi:uncharacterized protein BKA78DRAFT_26543 [Phyllosticta capitalensis]|uniref:uncharacterized protein n=1 Tax=Phyllosticta capitalensis TaxID=121624 RepID=UPI00312CC5B2
MMNSAALGALGSSSSGLATSWVLGTREAQCPGWSPILSPPRSMAMARDAAGARLQRPPRRSRTIINQADSSNSGPPWMAPCSTGLSKCPVVALAARQCRWSRPMSRSRSLRRMSLYLQCLSSSTMRTQTFSELSCNSSTLLDIRTQRPPTMLLSTQAYSAM